MAASKRRLVLLAYLHSSYPRSTPCVHADRLLLLMLVHTPPYCCMCYVLSADV